ncbi:hypothetical protein BJ123_102108 [Rhodopseudomonas thermotolerans]|jgi:hypothetical protein|uniref:Membrane-bound lysozyme inhibitor of c-type lysozyme MliC n=2 Tax=Rhodopseudomonas TaxID=1073 RepID=A0A336JMM5_9BRAD|nr:MULTISPECIES: hypothetical protein [Rhodopseudomonas]RED41939.1 hypothetical protein BJ125_102106 [Rhodopseudomonas pentothenatexigens]REG07400.1 hypothetical protein BJ123_102108 [Rhodopseudomonas thermotolerans]SSW89299.1 hypothetical protein SAMN05892882_102106 [Rhodopseudomonas pentothenatexigens]
MRPEPVLNAGGAVVNFRKWIACGLLALTPVGAMAGKAHAEVLVLPESTFAVSCANGGNYLLKSGPVAEPGQIVTARFYFNPHRAASVRLIPMGNGYRYAGRDFWIDGIRDQALLYLRKHEPIPCVVGRT